MKGKKLYRSREQAMLAGVCGGIGEYFEIDHPLVRLVWVVLGFGGSLGLWAYILAAGIIPQRPQYIEGEKV